MASQVDGAGHNHAGQCRFLAAGSILEGQTQAIVTRKEEWSAGAGLPSAVHVLIFDESSFDLVGNRKGAAQTHSIFCSHGHCTFEALTGEMIDEHLTRVPRSLCPMNSATMWDALWAGAGGLEEFQGVHSKFRALVMICDAHRANLKMIKKIGESLPNNALYLPILCVQHRAGNCLEQLTKFLGNLGGVFCVAKVMSKAPLVASLSGRIEKLLDHSQFQLLVHDEVPAALASEWREAKGCMRALVELACGFSEDDEGPNPVHGSMADAWAKCFCFFDGPFTGPGFGNRAVVIRSVFKMASSSFFPKHH